jgi:hypothetical protein
MGKRREWILTLRRYVAIARAAQLAAAQAGGIEYALRLRAEYLRTDLSRVDIAGGHDGEDAGRSKIMWAGGGPYKKMI